MPEIWLNYGITDVVLDIRAENLDQNIDSGGDTLEDAQIVERLSGMDLKKPIELAVLHNSRSVQKIISVLFDLCAQKSAPMPKVLAEKRIMGQIRSVLPEGGQIDEFGGGISNSNLVFIAEMELDGLFGYESIATRLLRKFGQEYMLAAYAKRRDNLPAPGQATPCMDEARTFGRRL